MRRRWDGVWEAELSDARAPGPALLHLIQRLQSLGDVLLVDPFYHVPRSAPVPEVSSIRGAQRDGPRTPQPTPPPADHPLARQPPPSAPTPSGLRPPASGLQPPPGRVAVFDPCAPEAIAPAVHVAHQSGCGAVLLVDVDGLDGLWGANGPVVGLWLPIRCIAFGDTCLVSARLHGRRARAFASGT